MLLPSRQGQDEPAAPLGVVRGADEASRQLADELAPARYEPDVGSAEARRQAELLSLAHGYIGGVLARRGQDGKADRIDARDGQRAHVVRRLGQPFGIDQEAQEVGLLKDHRRRLLVRLGALANLDSAPLAERAQHLHVLGMDIARHEHLVAAGVDERHHRRLRDGGRAVVERRVRDVERGQLRDQRLELEDRLQRALTGLRLVRGVGGVKLGFRRDGGYRRRDEPAIHAAAAKRQAIGIHAVPAGQGRDLGHGLELRQAVRQLQRVEAKRLRYIDQQVVHRSHANGLQHRRPVFGRVDEVRQSSAMKPRLLSCMRLRPGGRTAGRLRARA